MISVCIIIPWNMIISFVEFMTNLQWTYYELPKFQPMIQWNETKSRREAYCYTQSKIDDADCYPLDKIGDADFITIGWTVQNFSSYTLGRRNYWKIPWKLLKQFLYTASFKLKLLNMLKILATELLRNTLYLLPQRVSSNCGSKRKKRFFRC